MRTDKAFIYKQGSGASNDLWSFDPNLINILSDRHGDVIGEKIPISVHHLATWCYRTRNILNHQQAIAVFVAEFALANYNLVGTFFTDVPDPELTQIPLGRIRLSGAQVLALLQPPRVPPSQVAVVTMAGPAVIPLAIDDAEAEEDFTWEVDIEDVGAAIGSLRGVEEAAFRALAALRWGMHVIFTGPPGTGKTQLARRLCHASQIPFSMVAATDQWTTVDTIGGYFPLISGGGQLDFLPGFVVNAMLKKRVLIIDEINRADIDKAFGELFTLLSGNTVDLPYLKRREDVEQPESRRLRLSVAEQADDDDFETIRLPPWWRLIGSMNDADKASLKRLSYAFVRRFAFIPLSIPPQNVYNELVDAGAGSGDGGLAALRPDYIDTLKSLFASPTGLSSIDMTMGFALPEAMMRQARSELALDQTRTTSQLLVSTLDLFLSPQFQGRADKHEELITLTAKHFSNEEKTEFDRRLAVWTGYLR